MRAAVLREYGKTPACAEWEEPVAGDGQVLVAVGAAGLNPVDLALASGTFYGGSPPLPSVVGREGVGRTPDGARVYFDGPIAPFGSMAERAPVAAPSTFPVPDGVNDALAVCFGIAGLAAWLPLAWRAELRAGETVLVLGASGVVGQIGVQAARLLGAGRVVAAARSDEGLERAAALGADATVKLGGDGDLAERFREAAQGGVDVVLDPLWGEPAAAAVEAANPGARIVQVGQSAGARSSILSAAVRGKMLAILGHSNFATPPEVRRDAFARLASHGAAGELSVELERVPLDDVGRAWEWQRDSPHRKLVVVP